MVIPVTDDPTAEALAAVRRQFAEVQRLAHLGSWEWDVAADRITWSDELYRIYGLEPRQFEATYDAFLERIHPDDREMVNQTVQDAYANRQPYAFDHRLVRPDGSVRWLHGRGRVVTDDAGEVARLYGIAIDVTEQKRTEQFLREFIANAAHDLRTPVTAIAEAARMLEAADIDEQAHTQARQILQRRIKGLLDLSSKLLDLSALESGAESLLLTSTPVLEPLRSAMAATPGVMDLTVHLPGDDAFVVANGDALERVFRNLLANAVTYGGPNVWVSLVTHPSETVVTISDDGPGVTAEIEHDLFAPFVSGASTAGSGLGLAIVDRLMRAFGGKIEHRRRRPQGAEFILRFEAADADAVTG